MMVMILYSQEYSLSRSNLLSLKCKKNQIVGILGKHEEFVGQ